MTFVSYAALARDVSDWCWSLPRDISLVVGVPRSGMIPATMIGLYRNVPVTDLESFVQGRVWSHGRRPMDCRDGIVLVVDDSSNGGTTMRLAREAVEGSGSCSGDIRFGVVYTGRAGDRWLDFFYKPLRSVRAFQWNIMSSSMISKACVDIDGVLCDAPSSKISREDGELYQRFIANAAPRFLPKFPAKALVTCRLERDRGATESWLAKHGVRYKRLIMMDHKNAAERRAAQRYVPYKADAYKKMKAEIFIDDNPKIAAGIAKACGKAALCVTDWRIYK